MKAHAFEYEVASSIEHAVALLAEHGDEAKPLAGGQSLVPLMALRLGRPTYVIDLNGVDGLSGIEPDDGLRIGAVTRQRCAERSHAVAVANPLLREALRLIGHAAIRNRGTVGGSIAHADPAAELPTVFMALDGEIEATSARGRRTIAAADFFEGFLTTSLADDELLTALRLPPWSPRTGWSFQEFSRRSGDFAVVGVAATVKLTESGTVEQARVAMCGMGTTPLRATAAEDRLRGQLPTTELFVDAATEAVANLDPPTDLHGSAAYRRHLAATLLTRALSQARSRAEER